jgi:hypothetical protein
MPLIPVHIAIAFRHFKIKFAATRSCVSSYLRELPKINIPNWLAFLIVFFVAPTVT